MAIRTTNGSWQRQEAIYVKLRGNAEGFSILETSNPYKTASLP